MSTDSQAPAGAGNSAAPQPFRASSLAASLTVKDIPASMAWYRDVMGFTVEREMQRDGRLASVRLNAGDVRLLLNQDDGSKGMDRAKGEGMSLMFTTAQSVDALAESIRARGGTLASEPTDMPWGARVFRLQDPDGYRFAISQER